MPKKATSQAINPAIASQSTIFGDNAVIETLKENGKNTKEKVENMRINKYLAYTGHCSRRAADELVAAGKVLINGVVAYAGQKVLPGDVVRVEGKELKPPVIETDGAFVYIMLHKPIHVVSTVSDPQQRQTVLDFLPPPLRCARIYPVGRLDYFSEGLILLTNDGELTFRLTHPRKHVPKIYEVKIRGDVPERALKEMRGGMVLAEGEKLAPVEAEIQKTMPGSTMLKLILHQGVNRQIRRMCRDLGLTILSLKRIQIGPLKLGDLPKGQVRHLKKQEIDALRRVTGLLKAEISEKK